MDETCVKRQLIVYILFIILSILPPAYAGETVDLSGVKDLIKSGKLAEASILLKQGINAHPDNVEAYQLLGRVYLLEGNEVKALEAFDNTILRDKDYRERMLSEYYNAGVLLIKDPGKSNIGLHYLNRYLREKKDKGMEMASLLYASGVDIIGANRFMAHVILERAIGLNPSYERDEDFYFAYSVKSAYKAADVTKGGEDFLAKFPEGIHVPEVLYLIGEAYIELRKSQKAMEYFSRLTKEFPETEWGKKAVDRLIAK